MATIRDVARESGVSVATVSFVLNNGPRPVRAETRTRVQEVIRRLNFQPNATARGLARRRLNNIGLLFGQVESRVVTNGYASVILGGILYECEKSGFDVLLVTQSWDQKEIPFTAVRDRRSDGYIIISPGTDSPIIPEMVGQNAVFVVIAGNPHPVKDSPILNVDVDNNAGARLATEYLISLGHRRIAHISGTANHFSAPSRQRAFLETMQQYGYPVPAEYLVQGTYDGPADPQLLQHLENWLTHSRPTAVFCASDGIAAVLLGAAERRGIRVPEEMSVIGFDDMPIAMTTTPRLTTVRQPLDHIGRTAARFLIARIEGTGEAFGSHLVPPELIIRDTTAPYPV